MLTVDTFLFSFFNMKFKNKLKHFCRYLYLCVLAVPKPGACIQGKRNDSPFLSRVQSGTNNVMANHLSAFTPGYRRCGKTHMLGFGTSIGNGKKGEPSLGNISTVKESTSTKIRNRYNANSGICKSQLSSDTETRDSIDFVDRSYDIKVLSSDPKVFVIPDFLSPEECQALIDRAKLISSSSNGNSESSPSREMIKSNPPEVTISISKLWPLPILSFLAGIPPVIRLFTEKEYSSDINISMNQIIQAALPNVAIAAVASVMLTLLTFQLIRKVSSESSRTSDAMAFNHLEDIPFIHSLVSRVTAITEIPNYSWKNFEAPVITRYDTGAIFATHNDASPTKGSEWENLGGQRVVTIIMYLTTVENGGETSFDRLNIKVKPKQGTALVFYPADLETLDADDRTRHESKVTLDGEGEKWIVQMFGRVKRVPPPLGILDEFGDFVTSR